MTKRINKHDAAKRAILEISDHLNTNSILVGMSFMEAVERTLEFLVSLPEIAGCWGSDKPRLQDVRVWQVDGFPNYLLFYRPVADGIDLIFVCHASRNVDQLLERM